MGGSKSRPQSQTVVQSNLPEYAEPYFTELMDRGASESMRQYTPYPGQRLAFENPDTFASRDLVRNWADEGIMGVPQAMDSVASGMSDWSSKMGQYSPFGFSQYGGFSPASATMSNFSRYGYDQPGTYLGNTVDTYMSPYMQSVVEAQKAEAIRDAQKTQLGASLGAARQGTYGGARQLLAQTERERNLGSQLAKIQATGSQKAFEAAQQAQQYGSDLGLRGLQTGIQGTDVAGRLGLEGARTGLAGVSGALQGYQTGLEGTRTSLQGMQQMTGAGSTLGQLGTAEQTADLTRLGAQGTIGAGTRGLEQERMDLDYGDFLRQRDYPMEQLGFYSSILRGLPVQMGSTQTAYAQPPSMLQQVGGLGLSALGLYNLGR